MKRITVIPGSRLSLKPHQHRAEHWAVVSGLATVHLDGIEYALKENGSIYIQVGATQSLANNAVCAITHNRVTI